VTENPRTRPGALKSRADVGEMFGRIAGRYDLMNRVMTGGRDVAWRKLTVQQALHGYAPGTARVLDLATGTGDLAIALAEGGAGEVVGADIAEPMLRAAAIKVLNRAERPGTVAGVPVSWVVADGLGLPFEDGEFDACTVSFGLRNMPDYDAALREMARVLRPGGRLLCLEMTPLRTPLIGPLFDLYFTRVVPVVGGVLSGDYDAYRYLPMSVAAFPPAGELASMMQGAGFDPVSYRLLGGGTVALHIGVKSAAVPVQSGGNPQRGESSPSRTSRTQ
jgi:demethylmenaquinone methyltransferase / 2-methoxy-6-polyprenyl-1,4-benzoquinol methylase